MISQQFLPRENTLEYIKWQTNKIKDLVHGNTVVEKQYQAWNEQ